MGFGAIKMMGKKSEFILIDELVLPKDFTYQLKLKSIFEKTLRLIGEIHPDHIAIEAPFMGKNAQSMLKLGRAQGVAMAAALSHEIPVTEYAPRKIKMSITGNGNASKEQVAKMLQQLYKIEVLPKNLDAMDGLAAAVCHSYNFDSPTTSTSSTGKTKSKGGWASFVKNNPDKIKEQD
ncbi:MAG: crossover junction endodeoxyribonuclease RuvC [Flavobacteriaceae bacterium]|nr:MAG: crossover junction endodeoxyribonuclease RuvC [Flavobacteriaceae bacterium]